MPGGDLGLDEGLHLPCSACLLWSLQVCRHNGNGLPTQNMLSRNYHATVRLELYMDVSAINRQ